MQSMTCVTKNSYKIIIIQLVVVNVNLLDEYINPQMGLNKVSSSPPLLRLTSLIAAVDIAPTLLGQTQGWLAALQHPPQR